MLAFFVGIQYLGIVIIFVQVMVLLLYRPSNLQRMLLIIELATLVNHVGCLLMMQAKTAETALMAVKFSYIGKPYILLVIFLFLLSFYRVHIPNFIKYALCVFHVCISMLVLTCEHHRLFYSSMKFVDEIAQGILVMAPDERIIYENQQLRQIFASDGGFHEKKTYEILQKYCELGEQFSRDNHIYDIRKKEIEQNGIGYGNMYVDSNLPNRLWGDDVRIRHMHQSNGYRCRFLHLRQSF